MSMRGLALTLNCITLRTRIQGYKKKEATKEITALRYFKEHGK